MVDTGSNLSLLDIGFSFWLLKGWYVYNTNICCHDCSLQISLESPAAMVWVEKLWPECKWFCSDQWRDADTLSRRSYYYICTWRCTWNNDFRRRNWTQRHEFKSWTRLIAFHIALIPLGKVWVQLFSLQLWVNSRTDYVPQPWWGN